MYCNDKMHQIMNVLYEFDQSGTLYNVNVDGQKKWNEDYASICIDIIDEEYRDFDRLKKDLINLIKLEVGDKVAKVIGNKATKINGLKTPPKTNYICSIYLMDNNAVEIALYRTKQKQSNILKINTNKHTATKTKKLRKSK